MRKRHADHSATDVHHERRGERAEDVALHAVRRVLGRNVHWADCKEEEEQQHDGLRARAVGDARQQRVAVIGNQSDYKEQRGRDAALAKRNVPADGRARCARHKRSQRLVA